MSTQVCYLLQTHTSPAQVARLAEVIKNGSPGSVVLISHDEAGPALDVARLQALDRVQVLTARGGYGDFSHLDRYFAAVDWLDQHGVAFDWLENLSGQDYPVRPVAEIERILAGTDTDGYLQYAPVFPDELPPGADWGAGPAFQVCPPFDAAMRFRYRNWRIGRLSAAQQRWLRPLMVIDWMQPWVRLNLHYSAVGVRRRHTVFSGGFRCYGGSFFCTLSARAVRYARAFARENPEVVAFFRAALAPEEAFLQTVLINSGQFRFVPDSRRYVDFTGTRDSHPRTLGTADLGAALASGAHWARKFDPGHDAGVLDLLDRHLERVLR